MSGCDKMPDETTCRKWAEDIAAATREFIVNPYWKRIYDNAPEGAKIRLALSFCYSERHSKPDFNLHLYRRLRKGIENSLSLNDLLYLVRNDCNGHAQQHFAKLWDEKAHRELFDYSLMKAEAKVLKESPETRDRYANATTGAREWFCFSRWMSKHPDKVYDPKVLRYRAMLATWLTAREWCYVLDFEHERPTVSFITEQLHKAIERENTDACLAARKALLERKMGELERQCGFGCLMGRAAADWQIRRLQGRNPGSSWCFARPGHSAYCKWFNRYVHPTLFLPLKHMNKCKATKRKEK